MWGVNQKSDSSICLCNAVKLLKYKIQLEWFIWMFFVCCFECYKDRTEQQLNSNWISIKFLQLPGWFSKANYAKIIITNDNKNYVFLNTTSVTCGGIIYLNIYKIHHQPDNDWLCLDNTSTKTIKSVTCFLFFFHFKIY